MLESYLTPLITSYLNKYIKNIKPSDLQLSFWGGDAVLRNLELCPEAIEDALKGLVPFHLKSGCVKSLTIHIPWTAIGSEPINLSMDNIECTVHLKSLKMSEMSSTPTDNSSEVITPSSGAPPTNDQSSQQASAPGYVQGLLNRIINNIVINVKNLVVNIIQEESDLLMSVSVKSLRWYTANDTWIPEYIYTDSFQGQYCLNKMCSVDGMTVCLDQIGSAGHVEVYEDPFIPRCSFKCRLRNRFEDSLLVENIVDLMVEELVFSVTEVQFSLFLHLLDWLLAMYYSFKKLKGRDDLDNISGCGYSSDVVTTMDSDKQEVKEQSLSPTVQSPSSDINEQGWGSWLMSLVDADSPQGQAKPPPVRPYAPNPTLSMNLIAKAIIIDMKVNQKKRNPVFFASPTKVSSQVIRICLQGCSSHISRVPSSTLLGVSVGIVSINASISGLCPCKVNDKKVRHHGSSSSIDNQIHIYTLGGSPINAALDSILEGTFFHLTTHWVNPTPKEWLQRKDYYKGVWFSYEYYDKGPDRVEEICHEMIVLGEQGLIASPDVIHRVWFFIDKFMTSLEAVPLFSKGLVVIGDPTAKTHFRLMSDPIKIVFTANQHLLPLNGSPSSNTSPLMSRERTATTGSTRNKSASSSLELDSIIACCESLEISITMAMYSGNDTPTANQELYLNAKCQQLCINGCQWLTAGRDVTGLTSLTIANSGLSIPSLVIAHNTLAKGQDQYIDTHYQILVPKSNINIDHSQLLNYCTVYLSWTHPWSHPLSDDNPSTVHDDSQLHLSFQLTNINFELDSLLTETTYVLSLQSVSVCLVNRLSLPILLCPVNTDGFLDLVDVISSSDLLTTNEDAIQVNVIQKTLNGPGSLAVQLKALGCFFILERDTLSFINTTLSDLKNLFEVNAQQEQPVIPQVNTGPNRPDPEGLSSVDHYSPTYPLGSSAGVMVGSHHFPSFPLPVNNRINEQDVKDDSDNAEVDNLQNRLLAILNKIHLNVKINHIVIVSVDRSLSKYWIPFEDDKPPPFQFIRNLVINERALYLVLPTIDVYTTETDFYRSFATMLPGASSWQASLTNGTIYATSGGGNPHSSSPDYILHPFNLELSVAPIIASSTLMGEVSGYGVHIDVNVFHLSFSKLNVSLMKDSLTSVIDNVVFPLCTSNLESVQPPIVKPPPPIRPSSALSSPHLSQSLQYIPTTTASDSSYSISSISKTHQPSLWLQCTLTKLVVDLGVSTGSCERTPPVVASHRFVYESDDLSFSLDKQEKYLNCQLKVSTLEGHYKQPVNNQRNMFCKLFSSKSTVFDEDVLLKVESINRESGSLHSPVLDEQPPLHGLTSHTSFIVFDLKSYLDPHKPLMVKLHVKMFEAVVTIPLLRTILELIEVTTPTTTHNNDKREDVYTCSNRWPQFDISLECFRVLFPCLAPSTAGILLDTGGVAVKSDLSYPIARMEVNATAFRRLSIMVAEKRIPPLPGYEIQLSNIQLIGLTADWKDDGINHTACISAFPLLTMASSQIQYSPFLQWLPLSTIPSSQMGRVFATGNMMEVCVKSDVQLSLGISQIATVFKLSCDFTTVKSSLELNDMKQTDSYSSTTPFQILVTTNNLQISYYEGSTIALQLTLFDPVAMVKKSQLLSLSCSIFRTESVYRNETDEYTFTSLLTCGGTQHNHNLLTVNLDHDNNNQRTNGSIELGVSVCTTVSPQLIALLNTISTDIAMTLSSIPPAAATVHQPSLPDSEGTSLLFKDRHNELLNNLKVTLKTKQLVVQVLGKTGPDVNSVDSCSCCSECIKLGCSELHMVLPHVHSTRDDWLPYQHPLGTVSFSVYCTGLELSCSNHTTTCTNHKPAYLIRPTSFECMIVHQMQTNDMASARTVLSFTFDPVHLSMGIWIAEIVRSVLLVYSSCIEELLKKGGTINTSIDNSNNRMDIHDKIEFQDDLRQKNMNFNTANTHERSFPSPSEIRFFEGDTVHPPHMIWRYPVPHCVTRVHVLPVPLGVSAHEGGYPLDMTIHCEISYYDEVNHSFVCVSDLYLSETCEALWKYNTDNEDASCPNMEVSNVHASIWCLTIVGLKWSDDEGVIRAVFPLIDTPSTNILSPLTLAGCTCVDSVIDYQFLPYLDMGVEQQKMTLSLVHQPHDDERDGHVNYYNEFIVHDDLSWYPLSLMEFGMNNLKANWSLKTVGHQALKVDGTFSMVVQDFNNLTLREVIYPTDLSVSLNVNQTMPLSCDIAVKTSIEPCSIRISPTLIHTVTMTTHVIINHVSSHDIDNMSCDQKLFPQSVLFATYIVCNMTTENLYMGQDSTIEWLALPRGSCIGYCWNSYSSDKQRLRLALAEEESDQWMWSSPISLDEDDDCLQEITIGSSTEEQVYLYVEVKRHGGIQKQVIISGLWTIHSFMPHPLLVCPTSSHSVIEDNTNYELLEDSRSVSFIVRKQELLGIMTSKYDSAVQEKQHCTTVSPNATANELIPVKIHDGCHGDLYYWCNVLQRPKIKQFKQCPVKINMAPFFRVVNSLPFNVTLIISSNDVTCTNRNQTVTIYGCGQQILLSSLGHNSWYLIKMSTLPLEKGMSGEGGVTSDAFPISTCIGNQLPVTDDVDCGVWPHNTCFNHKFVKVKSKNSSKKTLLLPVDENSDSMVTVHVELQSDPSLGTIVITLSPDVLIVNETGMELCLLTGIDFKNEIVMDESELNVTAVVKRTEEFKIRLSLDSSTVATSSSGCYSPVLSSSLSLSSINIPKDNRKPIKRVKLHNDQFASEIVVELSFHKNSLIATLKPSHILINNTDHPLTVWPTLHGLRETPLYTSNSCQGNMASHKLTSVSSSESKMLGIWSLRGSEGDQLFHMIRVTSQAGTWSIPLLLNFVRHSFSLPVSLATPTNDMATLTTSMVGCLLTTHEVDGVKYLVISSDSSPRLVIENSGFRILEIREAHTHWVHSHSQTIYPHSRSVYEPPSLAMQYPLIKEWVELETDDNTVQTVQFRQLSDLAIQIGLRSHDNHVTWSNSFNIPRDDEISRVQNIFIPELEEESMNVTFSKTGRTTVVRISMEQSSSSPEHSKIDPPLQGGTGIISSLLIDLFLSQIVLVLDTEEPHVVRPLLMISSDSTHLNINHTHNVLQGLITVGSLQVDTFVDPTRGGEVFLCPRNDHEPPPSLLKPRPQSFLNIEIELLTKENILSKVSVFVQPVTIRTDDVMILRIANGFVSCMPPAQVVFSVNKRNSILGNHLVKLKPWKSLLRHPVIGYHYQYSG